MPASAIASRTRTLHTLAPSAYTSRALRHGDAALDVGAEVGQAQLDGPEGGRDVEDVVVADVADTEDLPLQMRLAVRELDAVAVPEQRDELGGIDAFGRLDRRDHGRGVVVRREQLESHGLRALTAGAAEQPVALERLLEPAVDDHPERDIEGDDERRRGRERRVELLLRAARAVPVEVEARRGRAALRRPDRVRHRGHGQAGRRHQRLLRAGAGDVDPPGVDLERHGAEARDRVDDDVRTARPRDCGERLHVGDDSGRRLGVGQEDGAGAARVARASRRGRRRTAPLPTRSDGLDLAAVALGELDPALAEAPGGDDDDPVARRAEVRDRRLHRARAGRREQEHVGRRAEDLLQPLQALGVDRAEVGAAVVDDRLGERCQHLRRHLVGPGVNRDRFALTASA